MKATEPKTTGLKVTGMNPTGESNLPNPEVAQKKGRPSRDLSPEEKAALWSWLGFTGTFAAVRGITYSIRNGWGPFGNVKLGGAHVHHYLWGVAMVIGVGGVAVHGDQKNRNHPLVAATYGSGIALIVDEFALLLDLKDVYWSRQGRVSVDIGVGLIAAGGTVFSAIPVIRHLTHRSK